MKITLFVIFIFLFGFSSQKSAAQEVPNLWPSPEWKLENQKDTILARDENGVIRWKSWFDGQSRDSVFATFHWNEKPILLFSGKRRLPLQGCASFFYSDGKPSEKNCWLDDQLSGEFEKLDPVGTVLEKGRFENSTRTGHWKAWYENGKPKYSGSYMEGLKDGKWSYFHSDSLVAYFEIWNEGELQTVSDFTLANGKLISGGQAKDGFGQVNRYHFNGLRKQSFLLSAGEPEGKFFEYDSLGRILRLKNFIKGELNGEMLEFLPDSSLASKIVFKNGIEDGPYAAYHPNGTISVSGWFKKGKEDSVWIENSQSGLNSAKYAFKSGKLEGRYIEFFEGQKLKKSAWFKEGIQDSISETWNEKGFKISEYQFKNGEKNGPSKEWFANGKPKSEGVFKNDVEDGLWKIWYENGKPQSQGKFENGKPEGNWITWFGNGKSSSTGSYKNGNENGLWQFFYPEGQLKTEEEWANGNLVEVLKCLSPKGKKLNAGNLKTGNGFIKTYNLDGLMEGEGNMLNGQPTGNWKYFYPQGNVQAEGEMTNGKRTKIWKFYHPNGKLAEESEYRLDRLVGKSVIYDSNGKQTEIVTNKDEE